MIEFIHVTKYFKKNWPVLEDVNLTIRRGEFTCLLGKSGSGKTILLYHIYMKELPSSGQVIVDGLSSQNIRKRDIPALRRKVGMIFQEFYLLNDRSVFENIALPLRLSGLSRGEIKKRAFKALAYAGLSHKMNELPPYLSSGEKQRICIARALVNEPIVLLADEPTGNLDSENAEDILRLLKSIHAQGTAVVVATHKTEFTEKVPCRTIRLETGRIVDVRAPVTA
jgi:cell division transport system ATP-binding protein